VRTWGKACFVGEGGQVTLDVSPDLLRRQVTLIGSWTFSTVGQAECATLVADRGIMVDDLFTHRWKLELGDEAYKLFDKHTSGMGVFMMLKLPALPGPNPAPTVAAADADGRKAA
jgi:threonine dehydrogenase-like Zn-dependent dehydrogenase